MITNMQYNKLSESSINSFPENIQFKYEWRNYQKRVLDELEEHITDNHLHIIAPPGSGKTILGLEVALRINKPTLIFAPTISIRNQWIQRFCELFLQMDTIPDWISTDIKKPKFLTVSTYQGMHAACSGVSDNEEVIVEEEIGEIKQKKSTREKTDIIIAALKDQNIGTIVVDEAHHLKNAWWRSLSEIKKALDPAIVGLTATPPYDVPFAEWERYIQLNGPVDGEISVPELVVEGNLCPHQDFVFFSRPTFDESNKIFKYRKQIKVLFEEIIKDQELIRIFENHPVFKAPNSHIEWIFKNLEYYSSMLIFLKEVGVAINKSHLKIIGNSEFEIPKLDFYWLEVLLTYYVYKDPVNFKQYKEHQEKLINKLKRGGAIERRAINFTHNRKINSSLSSSIGKLESIDKIVDFEYDQLENDLRMVVLTDYIRKEYIVDTEVNELSLSKIGVLPIFEKLRRTNDRGIKVGVLTGSLVIIPITALEKFKKISKQYNIDKVSTKSLAYDSGYVIINTNHKLQHVIVQIVTRIFEDGDIEVLVGTKSLLGEGWDAPSINALILASFVGSYVLSNQMRGRAIRTERENIYKTSNIWHLVCTDPTSEDGGDDLQLLKRRFKAFVGVSIGDQASIENGVRRMKLPSRLFTEQEVDNVNAMMFEQAANRVELKEKWHEALAGGKVLIEDIKVPFPHGRSYSDTKKLYYNRTIKYMFGVLSSGLLGFGYEALQWLFRARRFIKNIEDLKYSLMIVGLLGILLFGRLTFTAFRAFVKYRDISKDVHQIGKALLASLIETKLIKTEVSKLNVFSEVDESGAIYCHLEGGSTFERSIFIKSLQEIIQSIDSPRYVIVRKSFVLNVFSQKDYHSLPELLGNKKKNAEIFERQWRNFVGSCELIYTRNIEGRRLLLTSRIKSLASQFEDRTERINRWR